MTKGLRGFQKGHNLWDNENSRKAGFQKGRIPWNKGLTKNSDERLKNIGINSGGTRKRLFIEGKISGPMKGKHHSEDTKEKIKIGHLGRTASKETKEKLSKLRTGVKLSEEHCKHIGEGKLGNKNPSWNNGSSFEPYSLNWTNNFRNSIRERDNYICQICNNYGKDVHHIDYNKKNCNPSNLIILCRTCHLKTNWDREKWITYFNNINNTEEICVIKII